MVQKDQLLITQGFRLNRNDLLINVQTYEY
jgi:hypothetical protein